jgi:predicted transcriptional regulator
MTKTPVKHPRSRERLIVAEAAIRFGRVFNSELFGGYSATHEDATWVLRAVVIGHLRGRPMTTRRIARYIGMPRTTVLRRLQLLLRLDYVRREGRAYCVSERYLRAPPKALNEAIKIILETAEALRSEAKKSVQNGPQDLDQTHRSMEPI